MKGSNNWITITKEDIGVPFMDVIFKKTGKLPPSTVVKVGRRFIKVVFPEKERIKYLLSNGYEEQ